MTGAGFLLAGTALALVLVVAVAWYGSTEITGIPYLAVPYVPTELGWPCEDVTVRSYDGLALRAWFVPATIASDTTIIILHGMGSNAGDMLLNTACLRKNGRWNLFYLNFRGHGGSEGRFTSLGPLELRDLESGMAYLKETRPAQCRHLAVYGHSLGAAVSIVGASRHPELEAVAAESPFSYIRRTVRHFAWLFYGIPYYPFMPLALAFTSLRLGMRIGTFAPAEAIRNIAPRPLFLIHAERDRRMPKVDFNELVRNAGDPKEVWVVPGADHGDPWLIAKDEYERRLSGFFERALS